ncbi:NAD(P)/FAD-dependent oxidoreductase [Yoonia sp. R2331]|uniref:NAD(P)/FAD-dependent oxidoreductase n=1 Tax=Yoonia sp. R2331 TaxID=3237238 RepID=UPI0034E473A3
MTDFIIIGGGVAGLSTAARLSAFGHVTLIERERSFGYHASGRSAALFEPTYGLPSTTALSRASADFLRTEAGGVLSPRGLMLIGGPDDHAAFDADRDSMGLEEVDVDAARDTIPILNPKTVTRAATHAEAWDIDTDRLLNIFLQILRRNGGVAHSNCMPTLISRTRQGWTVQTTTQGPIGGAILVNAAGAWADEVAQMARIAPLGLTPLRRSMGRIPAPGDHDVSGWPMLFGPGETWYAKPDADALIVSPADEDPSAPIDAFADDMVLAEGFARYENYVTEPVNRLLASWAGLRTFAPDRNLVLGPDPTDPAFVWCAGQGGYGFQTAPAASALVADLVIGRSPQIDADIVAQLRPDRLRS